MSIADFKENDQIERNKIKEIATKMRQDHSASSFHKRSISGVSDSLFFQFFLVTLYHLMV